MSSESIEPVTIPAHELSRDVLEAFGFDVTCPVCETEMAVGHHDCPHGELRRVCGDCCGRCPP